MSVTKDQRVSPTDAHTDAHADADKGTFDLSAVRKDIDTLDQTILSAIETRADLAAQVAKAKGGQHTFRPGREADLLRNLVRQSHLPALLIEDIWRRIIAHNLTSQAGLMIARYDDPALHAACDYRFGPNVETCDHPAAADVIAAVASGAADLGILPHWDEDPEWLSALAAHRSAGDAVYIASLTHMGTDNRLQNAVIIAANLPDISSADMTLTMTEHGVVHDAGYHPQASGLLGIYQICDIS